MQKRKRWQFILILVVIALTLYNILPTIFFYTKPLKEPIGKKSALNIAFDSAKRVNKLEEGSISWLSSYCKMLKLKPISIQVDKTNPSHVKVAFNKNDDANELRKYLPRAGSLIPFIPAQLFVIKEKDSDQQKNVVIQRQIPINIDSQNINKYFDFSEKKDGRIIAPLFKDIVFDRAIQMGLTIGGESEAFLLSKSVVKEKNPQVKKDLIFSLARDVLDFTLVFGENSLMGIFCWCAKR